MKKYFEFKGGNKIRILPPTPEQIKKMNELKIRTVIEQPVQETRCPLQDYLNKTPPDERKNIRIGKMYDHYNFKTKKVLRIYVWD